MSNRLRVGISTGCFGEKYTDVRELGRLLADLDADFFEVLLFQEWSDDIGTIRRALADASDRISSIHAPKATCFLASSNPVYQEKGWAHLEASLEVAADLPRPHVTSHLWHAVSEDPAMVEPRLEILEEAVNRALPWIEAGVSFSIELLPSNGIPVLQALSPTLDALPEVTKYTLDLEFAAFQGFLEPLLELGPRLSNVHVKDYDGRLVDEQGRRRYCPLGMGSLDLTRIFRHLRGGGYEGLYTVETPIAIEQVIRAASYVRERLVAAES